MEQLYLIEIFIDRVSVIIREDEPNAYDQSKNLIVRVKVGPKVQFIIKEAQLAKANREDEIIAKDRLGFKKWSRTFRVGKSYLFTAFPQALLRLLNENPLELDVWNDDENEIKEYVGVGTMYWDTQFLVLLKEAINTCRFYEPLTIKQLTPLFAECCCRQNGDVQFILRLSPLGKNIVSDFQQLVPKDPDTFLFRTDKVPGMFRCKQVGSEDPNYRMAGSVYENAKLEDDEASGANVPNIKVCPEQGSCTDKNASSPSATVNKEIKYNDTDTFRMGDIAGPCGNVNCPLAHKVKNYIRNLSAYKKKTVNLTVGKKGPVNAKSMCGTCECNDDRLYQGKCLEITESMKTKQPEEEKKNLIMCKQCAGLSLQGGTCADRIKAMYGTGLTPKGSKTQVNYMIGIERDPEAKKSVFGTVFVVNNCQMNLDKDQCNQYNGVNVNIPSINTAQKVCGCGGAKKGDNLTSDKSFTVYNAEIKTKCDENKPPNAVFCTDFPEDKECRCRANKPTPPCKTFDCECLTRAAELDARKHHKPFCPAYKHKPSCPVTMRHEGEEEVNEFEDELVEPLPYGLDPLALGPCPVLGRPCTVPDGFARMYKTAMMPTQPPSYSDAGKVCCSKEYERIKKALKDYMVTHKGDDFRCVNRFNIDTERRCCDKEQRLLDLVGKSCCGSHSMAKNEEKKP